MKHRLPPILLCALLLLTPLLAACGGGGGASASGIAQKTEADALVGTYLGVAFTILRSHREPETEQTVDSYEGGLALRGDGTYVRRIIIDGIDRTELGTWTAQYAQITFTPGDDSCGYAASYRLQDGVLIIDAVEPCDDMLRLTRHWLRD